jgi:SAM-dependent methyltransferase
MHSASFPTRPAQASTATQDAVNERVYFVEMLTLLRYHHDFVGRDVLDVGVGTGRTSAYLAPVARRYEAIDYSPVMVEYMRSRHPEVSVHRTDMRDLSEFAAGSFDAVFAPFNVIDAVSHADRIRTLNEMRRVLHPNGLLVFSSHNRAGRGAGYAPRLATSRNPVAQLRFARRWLKQLANHARIGGMRQFNPDYALLNDWGHDFACLHYYIDRDRQNKQLADAGFELIDVFDTDGSRLHDGDEGSRSSSLMYVARRV